MDEEISALNVVPQNDPGGYFGHGHAGMSSLSFHPFVGAMITKALLQVAGLGSSPESCPD